MFATNYAEGMALKTKDKNKQYLAYGLYILAQAFIFIPLIYLAAFYLDSGAEKQRIIKYYRDAYARDDFGISHASEWSAEKLESKIQDISLDLEKVRVGCGNGDTAGCRYFGVRYAALSYAVLALQYKKVGESLKGTGVLGNPTAIDVSPGGVLVDKVAGADAKLSGWVSDLNNGTAGSASDSEDCLLLAPFSL